MAGVTGVVVPACLNLVVGSDFACAELAAAQFGLITRRQALERGLTTRQIDYRVNKGLWLVIHPGVYVIHGAPTSWEQDLLGACLWAGGLASHRSAGALWDLPGSSRNPHILDVTVTACHLPPRSGIRIHHTNRLLPEDRTEIAGIPTTSIERTLLDLGAVNRPSHVAWAFDAALSRGMTTTADLDEYLRLVARRGRRGTRTLRNLVRTREGLPKVPASPLETRFFDLLVTEGFPKPELQYEIRIDGRFVARVDFAWPAEKVILEMDGYRYHSGHEQWEKDRKRRNELTVLGWTILHGTWAEMTRSPRELLNRVEAALHSFRAQRQIW